MNLDDLRETGNVWFTGCTHFGHKSIIKLANRPFQDLHEMDGQLIERWNKVVKKNDTVFHLGDFAWNEHASYYHELYGNKVLITGNHDHGLPYPSVPYLELHGSGLPKFVLFHYPIEEWNGWWRDSIHVHCHTHQHMKVTGRNRINVSVEAWNYQPASLTAITELAVGSRGPDRASQNTIKK